MGYKRLKTRTKSQNLTNSVKRLQKLKTIMKTLEINTNNYRRFQTVLHLYEGLRMVTNGHAELHIILHGPRPSLRLHCGAYC